MPSCSTRQLPPQQRRQPRSKQMSPARPSSEDDALAWLESLAARQGAPAEELVSTPQSRKKFQPIGCVNLSQKMHPINQLTHQQKNQRRNGCAHRLKNPKRNRRKLRHNLSPQARPHPKTMRSLGSSRLPCVKARPPRNLYRVQKVQPLPLPIGSKTPQRNIWHNQKKKNLSLRSPIGSNKIARKKHPPRNLKMKFPIGSKHQRLRPATRLLLSSKTNKHQPCRQHQKSLCVLARLEIPTGLGN